MKLFLTPEIPRPHSLTWESLVRWFSGSVCVASV